MTRFCPNCGNQMSDNAKFCMECGAKLEDYTSGSAGITDNVIQRSQVGAASVGKVEVSPTINATATATGAYACRICGFPATIKCSHCKTYICGKCLKKVYHVSASDLQSDQNSKTIEQIKSKPPVFFCKECSETNRINREEPFWSSIEVTGGHWFYDFLGLWVIVGYFTEGELLNRICGKCSMHFAPFQCKQCGKMFCFGCLARKAKGSYAEGYLKILYSCPRCNEEYKEFEGDM